MQVTFIILSECIKLGFETSESESLLSGSEYELALTNAFTYKTPNLMDKK